MRLEKIERWLSIVTSFGVLLGVILLVVELSQNTRAMEAQTDEASWSQWISLNQTIAGSPDLADILVRGNIDPTALSQSEYLRFSQIQTNLFNVIEHNLRAMQRTGDRESEKPIAAVFRSSMAYPGSLAWWEENKIYFQSDFVAWADQRIGKE